MYGHLDCLRYAHKQGCKLPEPASFQQIDIIAYIAQDLTQGIIQNVIRNAAATTIQLFWLDRYYNPASSLCRNRLQVEYHSLISSASGVML